MPRDITTTLGEKEAALRDSLYDALLQAVLSLRSGGADDGPVVDIGAGPADGVTLNPVGGRFRAWITRRRSPLEERRLPAIAPNLSSSLIAECRQAPRSCPA